MEMLQQVWSDLLNATDEAFAIAEEVFNLKDTSSPSSKEGAARRMHTYLGPAEGFNATDIAERFFAEGQSQWNEFYIMLMGFFHSIDWTEPWIIGLGCFHLLLLVLAISTRKHANFQLGLFLAIMAAIYSAETLNNLAAKHWKKFATQMYFDKHGVFTSAMWSSPLLIVGCIMVIQTLYSASSLLIKVKRKEFIQQAKEKRTAEKAETETKKGK
mmetsp:Transcript_11458/g.18042  ORF Transcript_11458/g.18042 Transcript_11458/m.18042 type:complete len:214 (-) Transcript_11458:22-663(-)|eukprot:CAMPEP_0184294012 /NCGR_PEP_ID=MMETSP1049-20130417/5304_1 /TAXON_ID=77928 /ORGANISM="Proteomonas sulcata, Strain CCMP704" /LENGTH=213 /DNA_ID=CAMNT_0026602157 /DNA_START=103 /DNA_END=744 /DNA_ORIENTATION=-